MSIFLHFLCDCTSASVPLQTGVAAAPAEWLAFLRLHAKNSQQCIWNCDSQRELTHTGWPQLTLSRISRLHRRVNSSSVSMHALYTQKHVCLHRSPHAPSWTLFWPQPKAELLQSPISLPRPIWISLLAPSCSAPRGQQAAGLSGCKVLRDGRDDNVCPPRGSARDRGRDGEAEWRNGGEEKKTREHRSERSYSLWFNPTR